MSVFTLAVEFSRVLVTVDEFPICISFLELKHEIPLTVALSPILQSQDSPCTLSVLVA